TKSGPRYCSNGLGFGTKSGAQIDSIIIVGILLKPGGFLVLSVPPGERMQQVREEQRNLDDDEQLKYNNLDFINLLRQRMGLKPVENPEEDWPEAVLEHCKDKAKKLAVDVSYQREMFACSQLVILVTTKPQKITQYQVEGFFILTLTNFNGRVFISGGSFLGQDYMQLRRTKEGILTLGHWHGDRCKAPQAIQVTSSNPLIKLEKRFLKGPWDTGLAKTNKPKMTAQFKQHPVVLDVVVGQEKKHASCFDCGTWKFISIPEHPSHANDISSQEAMNIDDRSDPEANTSSVSTQEVTSSSTSEAVIDAHLALLIEFISRLQNPNISTLICSSTLRC
ncbi:hypothetical protein PSTT_00255, partial [Puccinia striiformis]